MLRNISGGHVQQWNDDSKKIARQKGGALKILQTSNEPDLVKEFCEINPDAHVACRLVTGNSLELSDTYMDQSLRTFERILPVVPEGHAWLEDGLNEAFQAGDELQRRSDVVVRAATRYRKAGWRCVGFNFSVANPARIAGATVNGELITRSTSDMRFIQEGAYALIENDGAVGYHNYTLPTNFKSTWYDLRHRRMRQELPLGTLFWLGEGFFDHGIVDNRLAGWRDDWFHMTEEEAERYMRSSAQELSKDDDVVAWTPFGAGSFQEWSSFEYANVPRIIQVFTELYEVADSINIGQGLRKMTPYLGQPLESEVYHFPGTPLEFSGATFERGYATWSPLSNETIGHRVDGAIFTDLGNRGDGTTIHQVSGG